MANLTKSFSVKIILVLLILMCSITCLTIHLLTIVTPEKVTGNWHIEYEVPPGNFSYFGLKTPPNYPSQMRRSVGPGIGNDSKTITCPSSPYISCTEGLAINNDGRYAQTIICPNDDLTLSASGKWMIQTINGEQVVKLFGMKYLAPNVDLEGMDASAIAAGALPLYSHPSVTLIEAERTFLEPPFSEYITYTYPNNGFVLLFPRTYPASGLTLFQGLLIADTGPLEYTK